MNSRSPTKNAFVGIENQFAEGGFSFKQCGVDRFLEGCTDLGHAGSGHNQTLLDIDERQPEAVEPWQVGANRGLLLLRGKSIA